MLPISPNAPIHTTRRSPTSYALTPDMLSRSRLVLSWVWCAPAGRWRIWATTSRSCSGRSTSARYPPRDPSSTSCLAQGLDRSTRYCGIFLSRSPGPRAQGPAAARRHDPGRLATRRLSTRPCCHSAPPCSFCAGSPYGWTQMPAE
jgi:hypothetical protein